MTKFILIAIVLMTLNQCNNYSDPNQEETSTTNAKPTGKRQHKPFT